jgi:hypothetical protein
VTHALEQRHPLSAVGANPLIASLRYRCECAANEVLQIQVVMDTNTTEEQFVWTMRQLWRDLKFEVEQHINPPAKVG